MTFIFLCILLCQLSSNAEAGEGTTFIYARCSSEKFQPASLFDSNLNSLLSSIISATSTSTSNSFHVGNTTEDALFGLHQCRGGSTTTDCSKCIASAVNQLGLLCPYSYGASIQLDGCYVRYDRRDFLGRLDVALLYKKCSITSMGEDVDFMRRRDDVLADLEVGVGPGGFRAGASGVVQGFSQCSGDLSGGDCGDCLREGVGKLRGLCGSSAAAEVFLVKCSVRYWAVGHYDDLHSSPPSADEAGRTVAIIAGILGGIAIFIIVLSLCSRAMVR